VASSCPRHIGFVTLRWTATSATLVTAPLVRRGLLSDRCQAGCSCGSGNQSAVAAPELLSAEPTRILLLYLGVVSGGDVTPAAGVVARRFDEDLLSGVSLNRRFEAACSGRGFQ
jgi:hypothetical protein